MQTVRLTMAQALVRFLENQYVRYDDVEHRFVRGIFMLPGHGNVVGLGQAIQQESRELELYQGKNEQGQAQAAMAFAKQMHRKQIFACTSSVGPGAANMVTAAANATANNIPLLLLPGDIYVSRQPDPVLQQIEQPQELGISTNDAFRPVCRYWDRIVRPEQLMSAMLSAMRVLTNPADTGAVCIALPQDTQGEAYDYPESFFAKRVHRIERRPPAPYAIAAAAELVKNAQRPMLVCGGGVRYSEANEVFRLFAEQHNIPFGETQAGKSAVEWTHPLNLGGMGVTGCAAANAIAAEADVIIGVGTRYTDFTTASKWLFKESARFVNINVSEFQAGKLDASPVVADAKLALLALSEALGAYRAPYGDRIATERAKWQAELARLESIEAGEGYEPEVQDANSQSFLRYAMDVGARFTQTRALGIINQAIAEDAVVIGASGSLPGDMQRMWRPMTPNTYNMEYGYSCMGYEVSGALGVKLAIGPGREVYAMTGDGSFNMLHSELITSVQEGQKINVMLFDNASFGCINNLQVGQGNDTMCTELRRREGNERLSHTGPFLSIDFAGIARAYGCKGYTVKTAEELKAAIEDAKTQSVSTLIDIKVLPKSMTEGYGGWWRVGVAEISSRPAVAAARREQDEHLLAARKY